MLYRKISNKIDDMIDKYGHTVLGVMGAEDSPEFAYTIGLTETRRHPELLIIGTSMATSQILLNAIVGRIKAGDKITDGTLLNEIATLPLAIKEISVDAASGYALQAINRYKESHLVPAFFQVVYPNKDGVFPWESNYSGGESQPQLWSKTKTTL